MRFTVILGLKEGQKLSLRLIEYRIWDCWKNLSRVEGFCPPLVYCFTITVTFLGYGYDVLLRSPKTCGGLRRNLAEVLTKADPFRFWVTSFGLKDIFISNLFNRILAIFTFCSFYVTITLNRYMLRYPNRTEILKNYTLGGPEPAMTVKKINIAVGFIQPYKEINKVQNSSGKNI